MKNMKMRYKARKIAILGAGLSSVVATLSGCGISDFHRFGTTSEAEYIDPALLNTEETEKDNEETESVESTESSEAVEPSESNENQDVQEEDGAESTVSSADAVSADSVEQADDEAADPADYKEFHDMALSKATDLAELISVKDVRAMLDQDTANCVEAGHVMDTIGQYMDENPDITYAYLISKANAAGDKARFLINWEHTDKYWGNDFDLYDEPLRALKGEACADSLPTSDADGVVISGYAPIIENGETVAVLCVDYAVEESKTVAADVIYTNGKIHADDTDVISEAVAMKDGEIIYSGDADSDELKNMKSSSTKTVDLDGKEVSQTELETLSDSAA